MTFDDVRAAYDAWSPVYDTSEPRRLRDLAAVVVRKEAPDPSGKWIVELGCGTGTNTIWFAELEDRVIALDFSERMLDQARRRVTFDRVRFVSHDIRKRWPIPDESADAVVASLVLEHVDDLDPVFKEAQRVLHKAGALVVCEFHPFQQLAGVESAVR